MKKIGNALWILNAILNLEISLMFLMQIDILNNLKVS